MRNLISGLCVLLWVSACTFHYPKETPQGQHMDEIAQGHWALISQDGISQGLPYRLRTYIGPRQVQNFDYCVQVGPGQTTRGTTANLNRADEFSMQKIQRNKQGQLQASEQTLKVTRVSDSLLEINSGFMYARFQPKNDLRATGENEKDLCNLANY